MARRVAGAPIVVLVAFAANIAIAAAKVLAALASGSSAILAEAIHSIADSGNEILLFVGARRAGRPATERHPFGHGKESYFWGLLVGVLLFTLGGFGSIGEGVLRWGARRPIAHVTASVLVLAVAFAFEAVSLGFGLRALSREARAAHGGAGGRAGRIGWRAWRESKDPAVFTVVAEDAAALAGLSVAAAGLAASVLLHEPRLDSAASVGVGAILVGVAVVLVIENRRLLVGERAPAAVVDDLRRIVESDPDVARARAIRTMQLGPDAILFDADLELRRGIGEEGIVAAIARVERAVRRAHPDVTYVTLSPAF